MELFQGELASVKEGWKHLGVVAEELVEEALSYLVEASFASMKKLVVDSDLAERNPG